MPFPPAASFPPSHQLLHFILLLFSAARGIGTVPRALTGAESRHAEGEEERRLWDAGEQGEGNSGAEEKKSLGISSHQLPAVLRVIGLQVPWPLRTLFTVSS